MGAFPLLGLDRAAWDTVHDGDLVALSAKAVPDTFSRWFHYKLVPWFHSLVGERFKVGLACYILATVDLTHAFRSL